LVVSKEQFTATEDERMNGQIQYVDQTLFEQDLAARNLGGSRLVWCQFPLLMTFAGVRIGQLFPLQRSDCGVRKA
jgi:hypothetical protein